MEISKSIYLRMQHEERPQQGHRWRNQDNDVLLQIFK